MIPKNAVPWEESFPAGIGHTSIDFIRNHGNREQIMKAKSGDEIAAVELVKKCIKLERVNLLKEKYSDCVIVTMYSRSIPLIILVPALCKDY